MRVELKSVKGPTEGRAFVFDEPDIFIFGRALDATCSIPSDRAISRRHFMLQINPPDCVLTDLGSGNGTVVNDVRYGGQAAAGVAAREIAPVNLEDGDAISAGLSTFVVKITHDAKCDGCGAPIAPNRETILVGRDGRILCHACTGKKPQDELALLDASLAKGAPTGIRTFLRCARCKKDVTNETGLRALSGQTRYVCSECRRTEIIDRGDIASIMSGGARPPDIDGYEYVRRLGSGGQGTVYLVRSTTTGDLAAVKTLLPSVAVTGDATSRFNREIQTTLALRHPNVVQVIDFGQAGPVFFFMMEYVEGTDLHKLATERNNRVSEAETLGIIAQVLDGLAHAHALSYVHRDIKPGNILLGGQRPPWRAKIADFGFAKSFALAGLSALTVDDRACGTLRFMPREQITNFRFLRPTSDVYSVAATMFYMMTGKPAKLGLADAANMPTAVKIILDQPAAPIRTVRSDVSPGLADVIDACLSDDESKRPADAGAMRKALGLL